MRIHVLGIHELGIHELSIHESGIHVLGIYMYGGTCTEDTFIRDISTCIGNTQIWDTCIVDT